VDKSNVFALAPGTVFHERYRVVRRISSGGMGAVYEVLDERTDSARALKVMLPGVIEDADLRERFEREARVTGHIQSDHIVRVSDAGFDAPTETPFIVMDLLRGEELGHIVRRTGKLPPEEVIVYLRQIALALDKTHAAGIVHRDLKPMNLFVTTRDDGSPCVKILDFGIAKVVSKVSEANSTRQVGTPVYMAPEQVLGDRNIGPAVDIHALGHIAYTLLVGEPYWAKDMEGLEILYPLFVKIIDGQRDPASERAAGRANVTLPMGFDEWFAKATAMKPEDRFERATTAVAALADVLGVELAPMSGIGYVRSDRIAIECQVEDGISVSVPISAPVPSAPVTPRSNVAAQSQVVPPSRVTKPLDCEVTRPSNVMPPPSKRSAESSPGSMEASVLSSQRIHLGTRRPRLPLVLAGLVAGLIGVSAVFVLRPARSQGELAQTASAAAAGPRGEATPKASIPAEPQEAASPAPSMQVVPASYPAKAAPSGAPVAPTPAATAAGGAPETAPQAAATPPSAPAAVAPQVKPTTRSNATTPQRKRKREGIF
jgi:serine/threonine protein kinase